MSALPVQAIAAPVFDGITAAHRITVATRDRQATGAGVAVFVGVTPVTCFGIELDQVVVGVMAVKNQHKTLCGSFNDGGAQHGGAIFDASEH